MSARELFERLEATLAKLAAAKLSRSALRNVESAREDVTQIRLIAFGVRQCPSCGAHEVPRA